MKKIFFLSKIVRLKIILFVFVVSIFAAIPTWAYGSLSFDGIDDKVVVPDNISLNPSQITIETWVKFNRLAYGPGTDPTQAQMILSKGEQNIGSYRLFQQGTGPSSYQFCFDNGTFPIGLSRVSTPLSALETDRWYYLAATYDGNTMNIYVDGVLEGSNNVGSIVFGNTSSLYFGYHAFPGWPWYLDGIIYEISIWGRARTQAEIQADMYQELTGNEPDLAGYWKLNEGSGQVVHDYSNNGNNGQLGSTLGVDPDDPTWTFGFLNFNGGDKVVVPNNTSLNPSQITVETWVKLNRLAPIGYWDNQFIICKGNDRMQGSYYLSENRDQFHFYIGANGIDQVYAHTPNLNIEINRWYHVAGTYDGVNIKIYVNGILQGTTPANIAIGNTGLLNFGYHDMVGWEYYLDGSMGDVRIWSVARTESEIQADMYQELTGNESNLVGYWKFNEGSGQVVHDYSNNGNNGQLGSTSGIDNDDPTWVIGGPTLIFFQDDFESYTIGTFPNSGGWDLLADGAGLSYQYVDNTRAVSGYKSLHLVGSYCYAAAARHLLALPSQVILEGMFFIDQIVSCGCGPILASLHLHNLNVGPSGSGYGYVTFNCDGSIYAVQSTYDRRTKPLRGRSLSSSLATRPFSFFPS